MLDATSPNGTYTHQQCADLDHAANSHNLLFSFRFHAKDADGVTLVSYLDIRVQDDQLPAHWDLTAIVSESGLPDGTQHELSNTSFSRMLPISSSYQLRSLEWNQPAPHEDFTFLTKPSDPSKPYNCAERRS